MLCTGSNMEISSNKKILNNCHQEPIIWILTAQIPHKQCEGSKEITENIFCMWTWIHTIMFNQEDIVWYVITTQFTCVSNHHVVHLKIYIFALSIMPQLNWGRGKVKERAVSCSGTSDISICTLKKIVSIGNHTVLHT